MLAFCAMFYAANEVPLRNEVQALQHEAVVLQARSRPTPEQVRQQPNRQLEAFYESFPAVKAAPDSLRLLNQTALEQGVTLEQGEYHLVRNGSDKLVRYEILLPVKADYLHLRKFISRLLADMPHATLDSVDFQRQKISDTMLDAQVKLTLFLVER
ncbi:MAG: type 4a pilus biogenesis protein PilO [Nitrosomonadales bacterium]|nr:type 4a pilus biogenesis protein PilO [Nitrosomonadales bacterium]